MNEEWQQACFPLPVDESRTAEKRWLGKEVLASRVLDRIEDESRWALVEQGKLSFTEERAKLGQRSVRVTSPTTSSKQYQTEAPGRPHGKSSVMRKVDGENWQDYNRVAFWVYPTFPGFRTISMSVVLHNEGTLRVPDDYLREGIHYFLLQPDQWNLVVWEIEHLSRDKVTGLEFAYRLQGSDVGAAREIRYELGGIELQRVEPDYAEGWAVAPGRIAYSHSGYARSAVKTAYASGMSAATFQVRDSRTGAVVLDKAVARMESAIGTYQLMDFSELAEEGEYRIAAGELQSEPFRVGESVWADSIWKTLNFFYCLRCGTEIPGIHGACHRDFRCEHDGKQIVVNGGWHDAGDLSQGLVNTAEAVYAMLELAEATESSDAALAQRLKEEAKWGLDWVVKTRFGDGYRAVWMTMDLWTDGIIGTVDDEVHPAGNDPMSNYVASAAEAMASRVYGESDPIAGAAYLQTAREDWQFARESEEPLHVITAAQGVLASIELYRCTGEKRYSSVAVDLADYVMACQQTELPEWDVPVRGYFYATPEQARILHFPHRGHEQAPIVALCELVRLFPEHPSAEAWRARVSLYADYVEQIAAYTQPYGMLPAGVYDLLESGEPAYREQVLSGIRLSDRYYLRLFPVWYAMRGNSGTVLSQTKGVSAAARLLARPSLWRLVDQQLEWTVGSNPFGQSLMYGEGYDYAAQYTATSGDICGSLPVGIQTNRHHDLPYWPAQNCYNYKEVWVHPSSRWLWIMADVSSR